MRAIDGYVCIAIASEAMFSFRHEILFGQNKNNGTAAYENLSSNKLTPYASIKEALKGKKELTQRKDAFSEIKIAKLGMRVAETIEELDKFSKEKSLAVIMMIDDQGIGSDYRLFGPVVKGKPFLDHMVVAYLYHNGFKTYHDLKTAKYAASEVARQGQAPSTIATFKLEEIV